MNSDEATAAVIDALDALDIPYMLVGSFSTNYYGIPRATQDADLVVQLRPGAISALANRLGPSFRLDPQMSFETVTTTTRFVLHVADNPFTVELFLLSDNEHDQQRFARRRRERVGNRDAFVPSVEEHRNHETPLVARRRPPQRPRKRGKRRRRPGQPDRLGLRDRLVRPARNAGASRPGAATSVRKREHG